jgi:hypothetical protein
MALLQKDGRTLCVRLEYEAKRECCGAVVRLEDHVLIQPLCRVRVRRREAFMPEGWLKILTSR